MRKTLFALLIVGMYSCQQTQETNTTSKEERDPVLDSIISLVYDEALGNGQAYNNLRYLCKDIGPRLSGSEGAENAVAFTKAKMEEYGFDTVFLQSVMVPKWVRGEKEIANAILSSGEEISLNICALGNSVGTKEGGIRAGIIEVKSFEELESLGKEAIKGKIVFYNKPMDPRFIRTGRAYGSAGFQRWAGPSEAAKYGAIASINRSLSSALDDFPHTGSTGYKLNLPKIPGAAISTNDAEKLSSLLQENPDLEVFLKMNCEMQGEVESFNVIGDLKGSENPEKVIVVGGHLDSWDLGEGAHDDGTGVMQSLETLRILKSIGYRPKNTLRAVMFMNEENGLKGGRRYAEWAEENSISHVAAIESDGGGFSPRGFGYTLPDTTVEPSITQYKPYLEKREMFVLRRGGGGADIGPLRNQNVPLFGLDVDGQRYFYYHHTADDVFERVNDRELHLGAAAMSCLMVLIDNLGIYSAVQE